MTVRIFDRRRAERFAQLLDEAAGRRRRHARSREDDELVALAAVSERLAGIAVDTRPDPEFRAGLRASLMARIEREGIGATAVPDDAADRIPAQRGTPSRPSPLRNPRVRAAVVVALAAGPIAVSGISAASGDAIPGDPLYGIKRSTESAKLAFTGSQVSRGRLYLDFARTRMDEAGSIQGDQAAVVSALGDMDRETRQGVKLLTAAAVASRDASALDLVDAFVAQQRDGVDRLSNHLIGPARSDALAYRLLLDKVKDRSVELRRSLPCAASVRHEDELGPQPVGC